MLRGIPNLTVIRPGSPAETAAAWRAAIERHDGPTALILSRQKVAPIDHSTGPADLARRGGYVLFEPASPPEAIVLASGSEVGLALAAARSLSDGGLPTRVVSLPSWELFRAEPASWRDQVLPPAIRARVSIEAGSTFGWLAWVTERGQSIGIDHFGASAPGDRLFREFGFTLDRVVAAVRRVHQGTA
jgi:transketolase